MNKNYYSIYDTKSLVFGQPWYAQNDQTAIRNFTRIMEDPTNDYGRFKYDYDLYHVGIFITNSGVFSDHNLDPVLPKCIHNGRSIPYIKRQEQLSLDEWHLKNHPKNEEV